MEAIAPESDATANGYDESDYETTEIASIIISAQPSGSSRLGPKAPDSEAYRRRLAPLVELETRLIRLLSDPDENYEREATHLPAPRHWNNSTNFNPVNFDQTPSSSSGGGAWYSSMRSVPRINIPTGSRSSPSSPVSPTSIPNELAVPNTSNWKKHFALGRIQSPKSVYSGELHGWWEDPDDPVHVLNRCAPAIAELWRDPTVRQKLMEKMLRLEESSGLYVPFQFCFPCLSVEVWVLALISGFVPSYLDEIDRITAKMYFPTDGTSLAAADFKGSLLGGIN